MGRFSEEPKGEDAGLLRGVGVMTTAGDFGKDDFLDRGDVVAALGVTAGVVFLAFGTGDFACAGDFCSAPAFGAKDRATELELTDDALSDAKASWTAGTAGGATPFEDLQPND